MNLTMWLAKCVRCGPMTPGELGLAQAFYRCTAHPLEELHVTADPDQAVIYFWSAVAGLHVVVGYGTQHRGSVTVRPHRTELWS